MNKETKKRIDLGIKITLIIIIILLLIRNCSLMHKKEGNVTPNGNVDVIEIKCNQKNCEPTPTPVPTNSKNPEKQEIKSLTFARKKVSVKVDGSMKLITVIKPVNLSNAKLTWTSSDSSIVSVDANGNIRGLKKGTAVITIMSSNGISATCTVTVTEKDVPVDKIILNPSEIKLGIGETSQIGSTVKPDNATDSELIWTSSDGTVVTVDSNGVIKGLKKGEATITAKTKDGKVVATCKVTVDNIPVEKITLSPSTMNLSVGDISKISATVSPSNATDKDLIWTTSDDSVVIVDKYGNVKGLKEGTATITAKTKDGKVVATSKVTVTAKIIPVENITLEPSKIDLSVGQTSQIVATVTPDNATYKEIIWTTSDGSVVSVDSNGNIEGLKEGTATITAKTKDGKVVATCTVTVKEEGIDVFDKDKDSINWNGSTDLKIFSRSIYDLDDVIAPEAANTYQFVVKNNTKMKIKYNIKFIETNNYNINMNYKLKKNDDYLISEYTRANNLVVSEFTLNPGESDTYYLDWKWISSSNDTSIGTNPEAKYGLKIEVEAESVNE